MMLGEKMSDEKKHLEDRCPSKNENEYDDTASYAKVMWFLTPRKGRKCKLRKLELYSRLSVHSTPSKQQKTSKTKHLIEIPQSVSKCGQG